MRWKIRMERKNKKRGTPSIHRSNEMLATHYEFKEAPRRVDRPALSLIADLSSGIKYLQKQTKMVGCGSANTF